MMQSWADSEVTLGIVCRPPSNNCCCQSVIFMPFYFREMLPTFHAVSCHWRCGGVRQFAAGAGVIFSGAKSLNVSLHFHDFKGCKFPEVFTILHSPIPEGGFIGSDTGKIIVCKRRRHPRSLPFAGRRKNNYIFGLQNGMLVQPNATFYGFTVGGRTVISCVFVFVGNSPKGPFLPTSILCAMLII